MADEAWNTMVHINAATRRNHVLNTLLRHKRGYIGGDSYTEGGGGGSSGCQCAAQGLFS